MTYLRNPRSLPNGTIDSGIIRKIVLYCLEKFPGSFSSFAEVETAFFRFRHLSVQHGVQGCQGECSLFALADILISMLRGYSCRNILFIGEHCP